MSKQINNLKNELSELSTTNRLYIYGWLEGTLTGEVDFEDLQ